MLQFCFCVCVSTYVGLNLLLSSFVRELQVLQQFESHTEEGEYGSSQTLWEVLQFSPLWPTQCIPRLDFFFLSFFLLKMLKLDANKTLAWTC